MQSTQIDVKEYGYFAGNQWRSAVDNQVFEVHEPYSGKLFARVAAGSRADGRTAVDAAAQAFAGWAETTPAEKARLFLKASEIVKRRRGEIAEVLARETGSTISFATFQQDLVAATLQQVAGWVYLPKGEVLETNAPGSHSIGVRRPLGVVASFTPWNGANVLSWRAVISPVAAGNTVVVKPSEFAPVSAGIMLAEVAEEAGFPAGVINVVTHAPGAAGAIADEFFDRPEVRVINLIGGVKTARMLAERAGRLLKRTVMELGGFNPMIILDDVDMDYAVRTATFGSFFHQGQICLNTRRIIIQRKIYQEFLGKFVARTKSLPAGDPLDPKTIIGPIITRDAVKLIDDRVKEAVARGAKAHTGAKHDGQIYYPTILDGRSSGCRHRQRGDLRASRHGRSGGHARRGGCRRKSHAVRSHVFDSRREYLQGIRDGTESPRRHRECEFTDRQRRDSRANGRRSRQRMGPHGTPQPG